MTLQDWLWIPNKSIGNIIFDTSIKIYIESNGAFLSRSADNVTGWEIHETKNEGVSLYVENKIVVAVDVEKYLYFKKINLIGTHQRKLTEVLGVEPDKVGPSVLYENGDFQTQLEFDSFGLQVWIRDDYVVSASCSNDTDI